MIIASLDAIDPLARDPLSFPELHAEGRTPHEVGGRTGCSQGRWPTHGLRSADPFHARSPHASRTRARHRTQRIWSDRGRSGSEKRGGRRERRWPRDLRFSTCDSCNQNSWILADLFSIPLTGTVQSLPCPDRHKRLWYGAWAGSPVMRPYGRSSRCIGRGSGDCGFVTLGSLSQNVTKCPLFAPGCDHTSCGFEQTPADYENSHAIPLEIDRDRFPTLAARRNGPCMMPRPFRWSCRVVGGAGVPRPASPPPFAASGARLRAGGQCGALDTGDSAPVLAARRLASGLVAQPGPTLIAARPNPGPIGVGRHRTGYRSDVA